MSKKINWSRCHVNPRGYEPAEPKRPEFAPKRGGHGPVKIFTAAEVAAFAASRGQRVAKMREPYVSGVTEEMRAAASARLREREEDLGTAPWMRAERETNEVSEPPQPDGFGARAPRPRRFSQQ